MIAENKACRTTANLALALGDLKNNFKQRITHESPEGVFACPQKPQSLQM
jgi:hypothetical protein